MIRDGFAFHADPCYLRIFAARPQIPQESDSQVQPQDKNVYNHLRERGDYPIAENDRLGVRKIILVDTFEGEIRRGADDRSGASEGC